MFQIYVDDRLITIASSDEPLSDAHVVLKLTGRESSKDISVLIDPFIEKNQLQSISLISEDLLKTWKVFSDLYIVMEAAGGIVLNKENELLMIYRNDRWDLPKGKIESGEQQEDAALREVMEETGVQGLKIDTACQTTYHIYPYKKEHILKYTYWFKMHTDDQATLQPQMEEGITRAVWMNKKETREAINHSYASIVNLLKTEGIINV